MATTREIAERIAESHTEERGVVFGELRRLKVAALADAIENALGGDREVYPHCPMCDSGLVITDEEAKVVADLSARLDLRPALVWRQALRVYQLHIVGEPDMSKLRRNEEGDTSGK